MIKILLPIKCLNFMYHKKNVKYSHKKINPLGGITELSRPGFSKTLVLV